MYVPDIVNCFCCQVRMPCLKTQYNEPNSCKTCPLLLTSDRIRSNVIPNFVPVTESTVKCCHSLTDDRVKVSSNPKN